MNRCVKKSLRASFLQGLSAKPKRTGFIVLIAEIEIESLMTMILWIPAGGILR